MSAIFVMRPCPLLTNKTAGGMAASAGSAGPGRMADGGRRHDWRTERSIGIMTGIAGVGANRHRHNPVIARFPKRTKMATVVAGNASQTGQRMRITRGDSEISSHGMTLIACQRGRNMIGGFGGYLTPAQSGMACVALIGGHRMAGRVRGCNRSIWMTSLTGADNRSVVNSLLGAKSHLVMTGVALIGGV